ncbi:MAG: single-strand DNA-binding protein [Myxococcales bacterium]|nr:single-strand DNA-binding protein [Myxococcales bacterium]
MGSVNKVILVGNLGADPELKYTPTSRPLCNLRIATTDVFKDKGGQRQERTEWHRVTVWGDAAENCSKYLSKGRSVYIEGRLQTRTYDKDGQKHYATDVVADRVVFLGSGSGAGAEGGARPRTGGGPSGPSSSSGSSMSGGRGGGQDGPPDDSGAPPPDDDIPF